MVVKGAPGIEEDIIRRGLQNERYISCYSPWRLIEVTCSIIIDDDLYVKIYLSVL